MPGNDDAGRAISLYCDLDRTRGDRRHLARAGRSRRRYRRLGASRFAKKLPRRRSRPASRASPVRAASPTISRSSPACRGAIEKKLNDLGIFHYWQLAELDHDAAHKIGEEVGLPGRADGWVAQAKALTAEAE